MLGLSAARRPLGGLVTATFISALGTSMSALAIPWLVLTSTGSAGKTGLVGFVEMAPYVAAQALGGPLVDRVGPRRAALAGNAVATVAACAVPALYTTGLLGLGALLALVAVVGAVRGLADSAAAVLVPATAAAGAVALERAAGVSQGANQAALLLGAPLGGALITVMGAPTVVLIDGLSFAAAVVLIAAFVRTPVTSPPGTGGDALAAPVVSDATAPAGLRGYLRQLSEGLRFIGGERLLLGLMAMISLTNLLGQGLSGVLMPVWVRDHLGQATGLGIIGGVLGVGALAGNGLGAWLGPRLPRHMAYAVGFLLGGAPPFLALAASTTLPAVLPVMAVAGLATGVINPVIWAVAYERVPADLQARVFGTVKAGAWIGIPFGSLLAGAAAQQFGVRAVLIAGGAIFFLATLAPFVFPSWRDMNRRPAPAPDRPEHGTERGDAAPRGVAPLPVPAPPGADGSVGRVVQPAEEG